MKAFRLSFLPPLDLLLLPMLNAGGFPLCSGSGGELWRGGGAWSLGLIGRKEDAR